jgi:hypothetical protein
MLSAGNHHKISSNPDRSDGGLVMKTLKFAPVAIALLCVCAAAQQNSRSGAVRPQNAGTTTTTSKKAVTVSGRVSDDGKMLVSEDADRWTVSNPGALAGQFGHLVTVKCQLSPDQNSIHVLSVKAPETKYLATHNDAAFRR